MNFNLLREFSDGQLKDALRAVKAEMTRRSTPFVGDTITVIPGHPTHANKCGVVTEQSGIGGGRISRVTFQDAPTRGFFPNEIRKVR